MQSVAWRVFAIVLGAAWAGWWIFFGAACAAGEHDGLLGALVQMALPGLVFAIPFAAALVWPKAGTVLLAIMGLIVIVGYPMMVHGTVHFNPQTIGIIWLTMGVPPILSALLLRLTART